MQQKIVFENAGSVTVNRFASKNSQSKDPIIKTRIEPDVENALKAYCFDNNITVSDFLRDMIEVGGHYHRFKSVLLDEVETVVPLLRRLSKKI